MPTYQYECSNCSHTFEIFQSMTDKKLRKCPECGLLQLVRLIGSGSGIIFKGSGYYETDYKRKDSSQKESPKDSNAAVSKEKSKTAEEKPVGNGLKPLPTSSKNEKK